MMKHMRDDGNAERSPTYRYAGESEDLLLNKVQYLEYMQTHADWEPGWQAIVDAFGAVYGTAALTFVGIDLVSDQASTLKGFGIYQSPNGYVHIVTKGLSQTAADDDAFAATRSGWGFELTAKCSAGSFERILPVLQLLERLSRYAETRKTFLHEYTVMSLTTQLGFSMPDSESFTAVALVPDTEIVSLQTVHGCVNFLQIMDVGESEWKRVKRYPGLIRQLAFSIQKDNPNLVIDLG